MHRDLKLQNIFITRSQNGSETIKLGDFGLARVLNPGEMAKSMVGTPYYMAPEILKEEDYSFKSDIWSLGIVLHQLCTEKPPFAGNNMQEVRGNVLRGKYEHLPRKFSADLLALVR